MTADVENASRGLCPRIAVTGVGVVSAAGAGVDQCFESLLSGRHLLCDLGQAWAAPPHNLGAAAGDFDAREWIPPRRLRRINGLSRMALVAGIQALRQSGMESGPQTGVVIGTGLGALADTVEFIGQLLDEDPSLANPALFPATVMNVAASQISIELGLQGFNTTVSHKEISGELALMIAVQALRLGRADGILCGGVDELSRATHHGYRRLGGLASGVARPYRRGRDGVVLGEGAALLLIEQTDGARARGGTILAEVAGVGAAGGDRPLVAWGPTIESGRKVGPALEAGVEAATRALEHAGLDPEEIDLVIGQGCGSRDLDRLEAQVLQRVFAGRAVPVTSPHGTLGTWMASGSLRLATAVEVLRSGRIYPTVTGGELDPDVPVAGLVTDTREASVGTVLVCGHAAGGGSCAVVLAKGEG